MSHVAGMGETAWGTKLDEVEAPLVLCSKEGVVQAVTSQALELLRRHFVLDSVPAPLPEDVWQQLLRVPSGEVVEWHTPANAHGVLGCMRYPARDEYLLLIRESADDRGTLTKRLHRQRLELVGRYVASVAHELRNSLASITYCSELLTSEAGELPQSEVEEAAQELNTATERVRAQVDGLLDYVRIGSTSSTPVLLPDVLDRAKRVLSPVLHGHSHQLTVALKPEATWVQGNALLLQQIFVNLIVNATEAISPVHINVTSELAPVPHTSSGAPCVRVRISDDGPGVPPRIQSAIFEPFFSTRTDSVGLGLTKARQAAESLGGRLLLEERSGAKGACFAVFLPLAEGPA